MGGRSEVLVGMVVTECLGVGSSTIIKAALSDGMSNFILILYRNLLAFVFLLPSSYFFCKKRSPPPITFTIFSKITLFALISCSTQICMSLGIKYGSPTLAAAMTDIVPAFTFILAFLCRMETLDHKSQATRAKVVGTMVSITGALIVTLYKGPSIVFFNQKQLISYHQLAFSPSNWVIGGFFLALGCFLASIMQIVQTSIVREYPAEFVVTAISCNLVILQSAIVCLINVRDLNAWKLKSTIQVIATMYSAIFVTAIGNVVHLWACKREGPVYVAMFKPLRMIIAVVMGVSFLGDTLHLGSVVGAGVIAIGFYSVLWGQSTEHKLVCESDTNKSPLLQDCNKTVEV